MFPFQSNLPLSRTTQYAIEAIRAEQAGTQQAETQQAETQEAWTQQAWTRQQDLDNSPSRLATAPMALFQGPVSHLASTGQAQMPVFPQSASNMIPTLDGALIRQLLSVGHHQVPSGPQANLPAMLSAGQPQVPSGPQANLPGMSTRGQYPSQPHAWPPAGTYGRHNPQGPPPSVPFVPSSQGLTQTAYGSLPTAGSGPVYDYATLTPHAVSDIARILDRMDRSFSRLNGPDSPCMCKSNCRQGQAGQVERHREMEVVLGYIALLKGHITDQNQEFVWPENLKGEELRHIAVLAQSPEPLVRLFSKLGPHLRTLGLYIPLLFDEHEWPFCPDPEEHIGKIRRCSQQLEVYVRAIGLRPR